MATAVFGGDCGTDRPISHCAFYDRRSCFLCRCRSGVEQTSALGDVISVPSGFPRKPVLRKTVLFTRSFPSNIATPLCAFYIVTLFYSAVLRVFVLYAF